MPFLFRWWSFVLCGDKVFFSFLIIPKLHTATEAFAASKNLAARFAHATPAEINVTNADALDRAVSEHDLVIRCLKRRQEKEK